ncbi:MAG: hypothetical protein QG646_3443 [Euryarchaeota archaeon]|nr:hypothetical protein [Euryarchaeota archaeon]
MELNQFAKAFDPAGTNYRNAESIQNLIYDSIKYGKIDPRDSVVYYHKVDSEHFIKTVIGDNGYIRTANPVGIDKVPARVLELFGS